ncbi:MAG: SpoIID/LytB domain-containing protein, partial [Cyanobacteria bacterium REEB417]|nr:SpoIID/LytB domain-containing protein [Cyanobacteria bacterium REEB417]
MVRVLLLEDLGLALRPAAESAGLRLRDGQGRVLGEWTGAPTLQLVQREGRVQVSLPEPLLAAEIWLEALALPSDPDPGILLQQRRYRGVLQVRPQGSGLQVINHVPLETYLVSVVGSEMPASWPLEALRAQAVAARTYALRSRRPAQPFDLKATVASQVYRGVETETPSTLAAVETTRGLVLTHDDALIDAVFHSSSGGRTESSGDLWPRQLPYLVSVPDFDHGSPVRAWRQSLDGEQLRKAFPEL